MGICHKFYQSADGVTLVAAANFPDKEIGLRPLGHASDSGDNFVNKAVAAVALAIEQPARTADSGRDFTQSERIRAI